MELKAVGLDCDNVRFRYGVPEKIGGWSPAVGNNLIGVARDIHTYTDLAGDSLAAIGTDRKLYFITITTFTTSHLYLQRFPQYSHLLPERRSWMLQQLLMEQ
jgi:hypothetical protein